MGGLFTLFFVGFIVLMIGLGFFGYHQAKKRRETCAAFAQMQGWAFQPEEDGEIDQRYSELSFLQTGTQRHAFNRMSGAYADGQALCFEYHYATHTTDSKGHSSTHHHYFSVAIFIPNFSLQTLGIRRENFLDNFAAMFGVNDIDFESGEFSRKFHVSATNKKYAYDVLHPRSMELLMKHPFEQLCFANGVAVIRFRRHAAPEEYLDHLQILQALVTAIPTHAR